MKCRRVQDAISPFLDGRLTGAEMLAVSQHLETCKECASEFEAIQRVKVYLASLPRPISSRTLEERIQAQIDLEPTHTFSIPRWSMPRGLAGPPQARRFATTFALSCVGLLAFAFPVGMANIQTASESGFGNYQGPMPFANAPTPAATPSFALRPMRPVWSSWQGRPVSHGPFDDIRPFNLAPQTGGGFTTSFASYAH